MAEEDESEGEAEPKTDADDEPAVVEPPVDEAADADIATTSVDADRPPFAQLYPRDPDLDRLVEAFQRGDYATVRRDAGPLAQRSKGPVRDAARDLRRRIDPDPLGSVLIVVAAVLLVFFGWWFWTHKHS